MRIIEIGDRVSAAYCGELRALGLEVSARTVRRYRRQALRPPPSQSWRTFLRNHAPQIWAVDLFTVQTATLRTLYVIVFIGHGRRRIVHLNVTRHPTASWIWRQLLQATRWGALPAAFGARGGGCTTDPPYSGAERCTHRSGLGWSSPTDPMRACGRLTSARRGFAGRPAL